MKLPHDRPEQGTATGVSPTLWRHARDLFERLVGRGEATRRRALGQSDLDPELRRAVGTLLELDRSDEFLEIPWSPPENGDVRRLGDDWVGSSLGPYRLVRKIGEGGSGAVFEAERNDAEFEHRVAVKILSQSPDPESRRRFQRERQILARLTHPHIARLIGGGTTPAGRLYFIMELVEGAPITTYCDRHGLSIEARLDLFRDVCDAVQHAHRNLIVHRDLKPSNILVTPAGEVKLLDFGIAKLLDPMPPSGETAEPTRWMTPSYASPEQILGRPITTSCDLYSLGILLYELLSGRHPHRDPRGALWGWTPGCSIVPPSEAWNETTATDDGTFAEVATRRQLTSARLRRRLRGDLDHIVMRTLREEPERRWPSADQLSADLKRHLAGKPIEARRGSTFYRAAKLVRRHRVAAVLALVLGSLILGLTILSLWQADRRATERDVAQRERIKAETVSRALIDLFRLLEPMSGREYSEAGKEILDQGRRRIEHDFATQPEIQATLFDALGAVYSGLGFLPEAEQSFRSAFEQKRRIFDQDHPEIAESLGRLGELRSKQGRLSEARDLLDRAVATLRRHVSGDDPQLARTLAALGWLETEEGNHARAEKLLREAIAMDRRLGSPYPHQLARYLGNLGLVLRRQGKLEEAEQAHRQALVIYRREQGADSVNAGTVLHNLAGVAFARGDFESSAARFREALAILRPLRGNDHPDVQTMVANLAVVLHLSGNLAEAETLYRESLAFRRRRLGDNHPDIAHGLSNLGALLREMERYDEARQTLGQALALRRELLGERHPDLAGTLHLLGLVELELGDTGRARERFTKAIAINRDRLGDEHRETGISHLCLAKLMLAEDRPDDALSHLDHAATIFDHALPADHWRHAEVESLRGEALVRLGRGDEARPLLSSSLAKLREARGPDSLAARKAAQRLASLERQGP